MRGFSSLYFIGIIAVASIFILVLYLSKNFNQSTQMSVPVKIKLYINSEYGYQINYPETLIVREFPDTKTGAGFRPANMPEDPQYEVITINVLEKNADLADDPLADYATVAATIQIQNYQKLNSINPVQTNSGIKGYQTTWFVTPIATLGSTQSGQPTVSLPITYFDLPKAKLPSTVQIYLNDQKFQKEYEEMVQTFSYN